MKSRNSGITYGSACHQCFSMPFRTNGQEKVQEHHHYKLIEIGTFGGPSSSSYFGDAQSLNNRGIVIGQADTSTPDPNYPDFNPCIGSVEADPHAFQ